jgi:hypothetical protein
MTRVDWIGANPHHSRAPPAVPDRATKINEQCASVIGVLDGCGSSLRVRALSLRLLLASSSSSTSATSALEPMLFSRVFPCSSSSLLAHTCPKLHSYKHDLSRVLTCTGRLEEASRSRGAPVQLADHLCATAADTTSLSCWLRRSCFLFLFPLVRP